MAEPIWDEFLTERDKRVFAASGYGVRGGFGKRPALLVIDVNYAFCETSPSRSLSPSSAGAIRAAKKAGTLSRPSRGWSTRRT